MIDPASHLELQRQITDCMAGDRVVLDRLRQDVRPLRGQVRRIHPRSTTAISLVGTDGGNTSIPFDPFLVQLIRVVDSSNNEYCLEAITPTTSVSALGARQFALDGTPQTRLGALMAYLGVHELPALSPMIRADDQDRPRSPSWVQVYRELVEWAVLFALIGEKDYGTDTVLIGDGLLRSKVFAGLLFPQLLRGMQARIEEQARRSRRRIFLAGIAKHSKVLARYRLAMALEGILGTDYPAYVEVPRQLEEEAYIWTEFARGDDRAQEDGEANKFVGGKMFFVKFGARPRDPIWPVDIFQPQVAEATTILGCMLADAQHGFPVPAYPRCLQRAHENAALVDFDLAVLQDQVFAGIRTALGAESPTLDIFRLQDADPSQQRYSGRGSG